VPWLKDAVDGMKDLVKASADWNFFNPMGPIGSFIQWAGNTQNELKKLAAQQYINTQATEKMDKLEKSLTGTREQNVQAIADEIQKLSEKQVETLKQYDLAVAERDLLMANQYQNQDFIDLLNEQIKVYSTRIKIGAAYSDMLVNHMIALRAVNKEETEQLGIIQRINKEIERLTDLRLKSNSLEAITKYNDALALQRAILQDINNLTNRFDPNASNAYDVRNTPRDTPKAVPGVKDETASLIGNLNKKQIDDMTKSWKENAQAVDEWRLAWQLAEKELINGSVDMIAESLNAVAQYEVEQYDYRISLLKDYYDRQQLLVGDNTRKQRELKLKEDQEISELRRKQARAEQRARIFSIQVDTAAGIVKTMANMGFPAAIPFIALAAATGIAQTAVALGAKPTGFKEGVIDLQQKGSAVDRDSIHALLMRGESVMTTEETKSSRRTLEQIRAKKFDDRVLTTLQQRAAVANQPSDMSGVIAAIKESRVDYLKQGLLISEMREQAGARRKIVRAKSISS
jgi:hypothetical protein